MSVDARGQSIPFHIVSGAPLTFAITQPEGPDALTNAGITAILYGRGEIPISMPSPLVTERRAEFTIDAAFTAKLSTMDLYRLEIRVGGVPWVSQERVRVHLPGEARPDAAFLSPIAVRISQDVVATVGVATAGLDGSLYATKAALSEALARLEAIEAGGGGGGGGTPVDSAPGAPTDLVATAGDGSVSLSWTAPVNDGGQPVADYRVQSSPEGANDWTLVEDSVSTATAAIVSGLANDVPLDFRVAAANSVGTGAYSDPVTATPTAGEGQQAVSSQRAASQEDYDAETREPDRMYVIVPELADPADLTVAYVTAEQLPAADDRDPSILYLEVESPVSASDVTVLTTSAEFSNLTPVPGATYLFDEVPNA